MALKFLYLGLGVWALCYLWMAGFTILGQTVTRKIRVKYLAAILKQDIGWFDQNLNTEFSSQLTLKTNQIQSGIAEKVGKFGFQMGMFVGGIIISFIKGAKLAAVVLASVPVLGVAAYFFGKSMAMINSQSSPHYARAGGIAEESLVSVKTVTAFGIQEDRLEQYTGHLD
eukprot:CAMPEP_0115022408 /NCGR_PEP_ID=MMETSP0216-20121206/31534_1 /TAXON_ID=223996 /ORGANISM="Protocruzia adherens, Strain Boccale" /LENGTH=169 /DNA_ID=CAMNT_0002395089 /DNA_START=218 /DNA_END=724 /DNA_ORIENTATION=-